ncbi:adenylate/guanylate cyclase domain-containing protein [Acinetobacter apis]|uniref:Adenylate cyclase, class 3 n=1 Tax=Acinetobacter apis TaxID=1229165 RepID=A0A217EE91_9GAMM|nr:adenylate/guanylate cyclase domain-containing protein [Acinetobacter apis]SNQ28530.1 Adenylate cyclase, class 3 [Acinetobacter apis]
MLLEQILKNRFAVESVYRLVAYIVLSLAVFIYYFNTPIRLEYFLTAIVAAILFPVSLKSFDFLQQKVSGDYAREVLFVFDVVISFIAIASVHFSLVFSGLVIIVLGCINSLSKVSFLTAVASIIMATLTLYLNAILFFGFDNYLNSNSKLLEIYSFICFSLYLGSGFYLHKNYIEHLKKTRNYYQEQMNRYVQFSTQLSRYASKQLWQSIMSGETQAKIEYKRKKMTIFFSDIQGFTGLAERLIPEDLALVLNDYLKHMTEIAKKHEATLDKFIGDGVLIFFGDPQTKGIEQDAKRCIEMAITMRQQMHVLRERWLKMGFPELHVRMGVSTGYCHVGNYGSDYRMSYTVIGHDVNLASRLQTAADIDEILISDATYQLIKDEFICIPKEAIQLKGVQQVMNAWQVLDKYTGLTSEMQQWFDYEYKGFHLILNLEEVQHFEYAKLIAILEKMTKRLEQQKEMTTEQGVARLNLNDESIEIIQPKQLHGSNSN